MPQQQLSAAHVLINRDQPTKGFSPRGRLRVEHRPRSPTWSGDRGFVPRAEETVPPSPRPLDRRIELAQDRREIEATSTPREKDGARAAAHDAYLTIGSTLEHALFTGTTTLSPSSPRPSPPRTDKPGGSEHVSAAVAADVKEANRRTRMDLESMDPASSPAPEAEGVRPSYQKSRLEQMVRKMLCNFV